MPATTGTRPATASTMVARICLRSANDIAGVSAVVPNATT